MSDAKLNYRHIVLPNQSRQLDLQGLSIYADYFKVDDEACLVGAYVTDLPVRTIAPFTTEEQFNRLSRVFRISNYVRKFLLDKPFLVDAIYIAKTPLRSAFGTKLRFRTELLEEGGSSKLFVIVRAKLDVEEAVKRLGRFDSEWWFHQPAKIRGLLEFSLDFE